MSNPIFPGVRFFLTLLLVLFVLTNVQSQINRNFYRLHTDNGLAQNSVWEVYQDYKGFLWIGTADGINRWDGVNMIHYRPEPDNPYAIAGNTGFSFFEDSEYQLWIFHNKGVSLYHRIHDRFQNIIIADSYHAYLGQVENKILVSGKDAKILEIDIHSHVVSIRQNVAGCSKQSGFIAQHLKGSQLGGYIIYQPSPFAISVYNTDQNVISCLSSPMAFSKLSRLSDTSSIAFSGDSVFVFRLNNQTNTLLIERTHNPVFKNIVPTCAAILESDLWVGGEFGIYILDPKSFLIRKHLPSIDPTITKNEFIYGFYTDRARNFYVLTNVAGLYIISPSKNRFLHYKTTQPEYNMVKSVVKTTDGKLITGQYRSSFTIYYPDGSFRARRLFENDNENSIFGMVNTDNCRILVVSSTRIFIYNHCSDQIEKQYQYTSIPQTVYPSFHKYKNSYEVNLINHHGSFILSVNPDHFIDTFCVFPKDIITCWYRINDNRLLVGTDKELFLYDLISKSRSKPIIKVWIKSILYTSRNYYLIATTNGVYVLNSAWKLLLHVGVHNGLKDGFVYGILEDSNGNYWMSHNKGLSCYDARTGEFIHYDVQDGLQSNEFNTGAFYQHDDGTLYFGGVNGVSRITPNHVYKNTVPPKIAIHQILVDDELYNSDTAVNELSSIILPYNRNTFSLDFSALDFSIPEKNSYAYFLRGVDKNWIYSGNRHFLRYANLEAGSYLLYLKASNSDGVWSDPRIFSIIITPPFWERTWFYMLEGFGAVLFLFSIVFFIRRSQKLARKRETETRQRIEKERIRISRDLHDHVGAQLSYLISQLDWIAEHPDLVDNTELWSNKISSLSEAGRNAMLTLRETIWAISHQELSVEEFADRFKQYVIKMTSMKKTLQVNFYEQFSFHAKLSPAAALHVFRICQEAVHNSMKHSNASQLEVLFKLSDSLFTCIISDNGSGFTIKNSGREDSFGLQNMKERAKEAGALFSIDSLPGKGTTVSVSIQVYA